MTELSKDLLNYDQGELALELTSTLGLPPFRARQLIQWVHRRRVKTFDVMTDISMMVREQLAEHYHIGRPEVSTVQLSEDGTRKFLLKLKDGAAVETVLIKQPKRYTLCVSSQVGCAIGCKFCRTGLMGLKRHLTTSEIVGQVLTVKDYVVEHGLSLAEDGELFRNIVFMGRGEPLHNYDNVVRAVRLLNDGLGLNFSSRKITVSTSGLVPAIRDFGEQDVPANLAVSLNATTDEVRTALIPINKKYPLEDLLRTLRELPLAGRRRVTMEYVMLSGVNDTDADLGRIPKLLHGIPSKLNLIPYNDNTGLGFKSPSRDTIEKWHKTLLGQGINTTVRWSKGLDISAACGQLASEKDAVRDGLKKVGNGALTQTR